MYTVPVGKCIELLTLRTLRKTTRSYMPVSNTIITVTLGATSSSVQYGTAITAGCAPHTTLVTLSTARLADEPSALTVQRAEPGNGLDQAGPGPSLELSTNLREVFTVHRAFSMLKLKIYI